MENFNEDLWKSAVIKAMEDYDDYDPELIKRLQKDWEDLLNRIKENKA